MPSLLIWSFFVAGAVAAAGPVIIHLLNRRRYRTVEWAAMDFLRQALQRNRKLLQIRDLVLLLLRTAAVFLFGLALAQPSCTSTQDAGLSNSPVHAVLLIDNSLSLGYQDLEGTLLDRAKDRAKDLITQLPQGSRISVIPLCGSREAHSPDPYATAEAAEAALTKIELVDRAAYFDDALNKAQQAFTAGPQLGRRLMLFTDAQRYFWESHSGGDLSRLEAELQVVNVAPSGERENTWVADVRLQDGIADTETPATIVAVVRHEGAAARENCKVSLSVAEQPSGDQVVSLSPGGQREVVFKYQFSETERDSGQATFVPVQITLDSDQLPTDDSRTLMAPVLAGVPVVFVDQFAGKEDLKRGKIGETRLLRRLLAPKIRGEDEDRQLVRKRYVEIEALAGPEARVHLADARLVVVAGVADPGAAVGPLREYVEQGGQLLVAAGGDFDPAAWNNSAWLSGAGILPAPLAAEMEGGLPAELGDKLKPFQLAYNAAMQNRGVFQVADVPREGLDELYKEPLFFQAVKVEANSDTLDKLHAAEVKRLDDSYRFATEAQARDAEWKRRDASGKLSETERAEWNRDREQLRRSHPDWLRWRPESVAGLPEQLPSEPAERAQKLDELAARSRFTVLAEYDRAALPFLVERPIGKGRVIFCSSGLLPQWNTLATTNAVLLFDRLVRSELEASLPRRNFAVADRITLPLPGASREARLMLQRPGAKENEATPLDVTFIGGEALGTAIDSPLARGVYRIRPAAEAGLATASVAAAEKRPLAIDVAVNGDSQESNLRGFPRDDFEKLAAGKMRWVNAGETISLAGTLVSGQNSWRWLIGLVLVLLLVELALLAWPVWKLRQETPAPAAATT